MPPATTFEELEIEAARLLAAGVAEDEVSRTLRHQGLDREEARDLLLRVGRTVSRARVQQGLRAILGGGLWFVGGVGVLLCSWALRSGGGGGLLVWAVMAYGLIIMGKGLLLAFLSAGDQVRSTLVRLGVLLTLVVLVAGSVAVRAYQDQLRHDAALEALAADLAMIGRFNQMESELAAELEVAAEDLEAGVEALRRHAPGLAAFGERFEAMSGRAAPGGEGERGLEGAARAFRDLVGHYQREASLYGDLAEAAALEPPAAAWLRALPLLESLDRSLEPIAASRRELQTRLDGLPR